jgi:hypothetical protein
MGPKQAFSTRERTMATGIRPGATRRRLPIHVFPVADLEHDDHQASIFDRVQNAIATHPHAKHVLESGELPASGWTRFAG